MEGTHLSNESGPPVTPDGLSGMQLSPENLEQAFSLFNEVSAQLTGAYQELQQQVQQLTQELAITNGELRRQLQEKEALSQRLSRLLTALPGGVVVLNASDAVEEVNPPAEQMFGKSLLQLPWETIKRQALKETEVPHEWELALPGATPNRRVSVSDNALDDSGGRILLIHDITEAHITQLELERHQRLSAMGEMVASLAHQLRTPLATAMLYTSHLGKTNLAEEERARFAEKALARLRHLETLIQDMLSFVRGETTAKEAISVSTLLTELQQVMDPQMKQRGLNYTVLDNADGAVVKGNYKSLVGAMLNLLENAMNACGEHGDIQLNAVADDGMVTITVTDSGIGIPQELHERLFEPFFTTRTDGTGLGLAIVREVAQAHGGEIKVFSEAGAGSQFVFSLPKMTN